MFEIKVEGIYESQTGNGQSQYINFNLTFTTSRPDIKGIDTHIQKRYIPYYLKTIDKYKKQPFTKLKSYIITSFKKLDETPSIINKDITKMNDLEIQDAACYYDLYEVPLYGIYPTWEMQNKLGEIYLKQVLKMPMKNANDKALIEQFKKQPDGNYKFILAEGELIFKHKNKFFKTIEEAKKVKLSIADFDNDDEPYNLADDSDEKKSDDDLGDISKIVE